LRPGSDFGLGLLVPGFFWGAGRRFWTLKTFPGLKKRGGGGTPLPPRISRAFCFILELQILGKLTAIKFCLFNSLKILPFLKAPPGWKPSPDKNGFFDSDVGSSEGPFSLSVKAAGSDRSGNPDLGK